MALGNIKLFSALKQKMHWHEARQSLLAQNVANADTPNYRARDLKALEFKNSFAVSEPRAGGLYRTNKAHISSSISTASLHFKENRVSTFEITPEGNSVVLEEEMMKMTSNQIDYQAAVTLYQRSLGLLKTAIGRNA